MKKTLLLLAVVPVLAGDFVNLTLDEPDLSGPLTEISPGGALRGNAAQLVPGWNLVVGGELQTSLTWSPHPWPNDRPPLGLVQHLPDDTVAIPRLGIAYLQVALGLPRPDIRLSQRGTIPAGTSGLWVASDFVSLSVDGVKIVDSRAFRAPFNIDVSKYAGQEVTLEFELTKSGFFDVMGFVPVPEPSTWALFSVGAAAMLGWVRRKR